MIPSPKFIYVTRRYLAVIPRNPDADGDDEFRGRTRQDEIDIGHTNNERTATGGDV